MGDVWFDHFKNGSIAKTIKTLQAGMRLLMRNDITEGLLTDEHDCAVKFSRKFQEKITKYQAQGYTFQEATIAYIVVWYCEEDGKEYRVVLPKICLRKEP